MDGHLWKILLVVGALSASGHPTPSQKLLTYDEAIEQGVVNYNLKAQEGSFYQLLDAVPQPDWDPNFEGTQELTFTIQETDCPVKEEGGSLDKCNFKEGGVVRECTATYFLGEKTPVAVLDCKAVEEIEEEKEEEVVEDKEEEKVNQEEEKEEDQPERSNRAEKTVKVRVEVPITKNTKIVFEVTVSKK